MTYVTIENILINGLYNDLGFMVGNRLVILTEAQSAGGVNIIIRVLLYLAQTYHDYLAQTRQPLYASKQVQIPEPELYVIYTGKRQERPAEISLSKEFFCGKECAVDVKVKMIYDGTVSAETVESERYDEKVETARRLIEIGKLSLEDIAAGTGLTIEKVKEIADLQLV